MPLGEANELIPVKCLANNNNRHCFRKFTYNRERQISYDITHMWNLILKNDAKELIYKTETDSQISKTNLWLPKGRHGRGEE